MRKRGRQIDLGPALESLVKGLDKGGAYTALRVTTAWAHVAQGVVASHATGAHMREGTLVVYVDGNSWATHFSAEAERYRKAVNDELGEELVGEVRFIVSRRAAEDRTQAGSGDPRADTDRENDAQPPQLSESERGQVRASVSAIPDEELRDAVFRATVKDLEWKKAPPREPS